jgi:hypothetical protein
MVTHRTLFTALAALTAFTAVLLPAQAGCEQPAAAPPPPALQRNDPTLAGDGALAATSTTPSVAPRQSVTAAQRVDAVRTVKLFCDLVDRGRVWRASDLFVARHLWARRELRALETFRLRSARIVSAPDPHTLIVFTRVLVHAGRGSALGDGVATLFFTLGRVGTTAGGWLITAITSSP